MILKCGFCLQYERVLKQSEYLEKCGVDFENSTSVNDQNLTASQHFPFMALIVLENMNMNLTGALISDKLILTRGNPLIYPKSPMRFRTLSLDRVKVFLSSKKVEVKRILVHPEIQISVNDIALIVLENSVEFNNKIQPVCLWISSTSTNNFNNFYMTNNHHDTINNSNISSVKCQKNESLLVCDNKNETKTSCNENNLLFLFINQKWFLRGIQLSCESYEEINLKTSIWILNKMFRDGRGAKWGIWMHLLALLTATMVIVSIGLATIAYNLYTKRKMSQAT